MPIYNYKCPICKHEEEKNVPIDDRDMQDCVQCKTETQRIIRFTGAVYAPTSTGGMKV
jgi:putative FmdB family regulatory protein